MNIEVPRHGLILSVIGGPADDPLVQGNPMVQLMEGVRQTVFPDKPSMGVHGDGVNTWEVASADIETMKPRAIPEFKKYFQPDMSTDRYCIYVDVPTNFLVGWITIHAGDEAARPLIQRAIAAGFEG